jgi:hypothetical protein
LPLGWALTPIRRSTETRRTAVQRAGGGSSA